MKRLLLLLALLAGFVRAEGQCLTNSIIVNTGYDPIAGAPIATGTHDPHWQVTGMTTACSGVCGCSAPFQAWAIPPLVLSGYDWATNPNSQWINFYNGTGYATNNVDLYSVTLTRSFRTCGNDSVTLNFQISNDNYITSLNIDGGPVLFSQPPFFVLTNFTTFTSFTATVYLTAGTHSLNVEVGNESAAIPMNAHGLNIVGTISSTTGASSIVKESDAACASYMCSGCDNISLPDTITACPGAIVTLPATITGPDSVLSIRWWPGTGLSDTTVAAPTLTVSGAGYYYITVDAVEPTNLVVNGDFSAGNTGFSSSYTYQSPPATAMGEALYSVTTDPHNVHLGAYSFHDHTTGAGNMMVINAASAPIDVWCQTIALTPGTWYDFSSWFSNWSSDTTSNFPEIQFEINGVLLTSAPFSFPGTPGLWTQFASSWYSGTSTTATICIHDAETASLGNDFAIDDISFSPLCVAKDSVYIKLCTVATSCATINLPDTITACSALSEVMPATLTGGDSVISMVWSPATGLSDTSILAPTISLTAPYTGYYYFTVETISPTSLLTNGNFSGGYTGYSTGYTVESPASTSTPGKYALDVNPNVYDAAWPVMGDHTTGTGNMMIVDGSPSAGTSFWCETVTVLPNTKYIFSLWDALLHTPLPSIQVTINGIPVSTFATSGTAGVWNYFGVQWNSGAATTATICMTDLNTTAYGNDFAIDDIAFRPICVSKDSVYVSVTLPGTTHHTTDTSFCVSTGSLTLTGPASATSYSWNTGSSAASINVSAGGTYWVIGNGSCITEIDTFHVTMVSDTVVTFSQDTALCSGSSMTLAGPTGYSAYSWNTGSSSASITVSAAGLYFVTATGNCKIVGDTFNVGSKPAPTVKLGNDTTICEGKPFILIANATDGVTYSWSTGTSDSVVTVSNQGTYMVTVNLNGCLASDTINVSEIYLPQLLLGPDTFLCSGSRLLLSTNGLSATWSTGQHAVSITVDAPGDYWAVVSNQCGTARDEVVVEGGPCNVGVPSAFSPNGDNANDILYVRGEGVRSVDLRIFNRWGQMVFETKDMSIGWDGSYKGEPQTIDIYAYTLYAILQDGSIKQLKGNITLLR